MGPMYHDGMRELQDLRETRPLADRLEQVVVRTAFTPEDIAFIERCRMFFVPAWTSFEVFRDALPPRDREDDPKA